MTDAPITQTEIDRWNVALSEMTPEDGEPPGDFSRLLAAAEAGLARLRAESPGDFDVFVSGEEALHG